MVGIGIAAILVHTSWDYDTNPSGGRLEGLFIILQFRPIVRKSQAQEN